LACEFSAGRCDIDAQIASAMELQKQGVAQNELERVFKLALSVFT
jgi:hypothetical protein